MNPLLTKNYTAEAAVVGHRIVKFGGADGSVLMGAANTDSLMGVSESLGAEVGERVDVVRQGLALVEFGGNVSRGDPLTSDAQGKAVALGTGAGRRRIGFAEVDAVDGDIADLFIAPGSTEG